MALLFCSTPRTSTIRTCPTVIYSHPAELLGNSPCLGTRAAFFCSQTLPCGVVWCRDKSVEFLLYASANSAAWHRILMGGGLAEGCFGCSRTGMTAFALIALIYASRPGDTNFRYRVSLGYEWTVEALPPMLRMMPTFRKSLRTIRTGTRASVVSVGGGAAESGKGSIRRLLRAGS